MTDSISPLGRMPSLQPISPLDTPAPAMGSALPAGPQVSFQDLLMKSLDQVQNYDNAAQSAIEQGLMTGDLNQAEVFMAMKKADMAYRTMIEVRNKLIDAYNEIQQMRM